MNWWNEGLQLKLRIHPAGLALAVLYAIACWATRQLSLDQFYLPAGVRVAAVLLCPPRLWPYLLLGEYAYFAQMRVPMIERYGLTWVILGSVFQMPVVMTIVYLHRNVISAVKNAWLISIAAFAAVSVTLINLLLANSLWPTPPAFPLLTGIVRLVVGDFIGILTFAPLVLLWSRGKAEVQVRKRDIAQMAGALALMVVFGLWAADVPADAVTTKVSLQLLMALPAVLLTCVYGWRGAAIGVPTLNMIIGLTTPSSHPESFDPASFATQQIMAVTGAALLILGSRITHYYHRYRLREVGEKNAIRLARSSHVASELDLRERALHLRKLGDGIDHALDEVINWLTAQGHHAIAESLVHVASIHSRQFREQTSMIYPTALEQLGLYVALRAGGVREAWEKTARVANPSLLGDPCQLSVGLQLAAYRTVIDAVSLLIQGETGQIHVRARCGRMGSHRGILIAVSMLDQHQRLSDTTVAAAMERLAGRTLAYGGTLKCNRNRIVLAMKETGAAAPLDAFSSHARNSLSGLEAGPSRAQA
ncbi:hypothetical protein ARC02_06480 [Stenotrophomonas africana]|nr:MASE1 domain-containing protein [Stenotrophomonas maltophilia]KRG55776.1 hypothetical protein ARC02_06480 [Stenotrophomonas maltophilia]